MKGPFFYAICLGARRELVNSNSRYFTDLMSYVSLPVENSVLMRDITQLPILMMWEPH